MPTLEAFKDLDVLVIATTGGSQTEELKRRYPQENVIIEDFIPFGDVMPYADVYVSNGGYGGVLLAMKNELPCVVAGVHEGKSEICARIGYFNLGINLKTETPKALQIKKSVEDILVNSTYKQNVKVLAKEFAGYDPNKICARHVDELIASQEVILKEEFIY